MRRNTGGDWCLQPVRGPSRAPPTPTMTPIDRRAFEGKHFPILSSNHIYQVQGQKSQNLNSITVQTSSCGIPAFQLLEQFGW